MRTSNATEGPIVFGKQLPICVLALTSVGLAIFLLGCGQSPVPETSSSGQPASDVQRRAAVPASDLRKRQVEFLNKIRSADPQYKTIDRAVLNEQNELGLILDQRVEMDSIPALMKSILTGMAKEFPGQDLTVIAYTPSSPPRKIGTANLNARTRDMTYTAAVQ